MEVAKPAVLSATAATVLLSISLNTPVLIPTILSIFLYLHNTFTAVFSTRNEWTEWFGSELFGMPRCWTGRLWWWKMYLSLWKKKDYEILWTTNGRVQYMNVYDLNNIDDGEWKAQMDARPKASKASEFVVVAVIVPVVSIGLHLNWTTTGATRAALASMSPARTGKGCGPCTPHCYGCSISGAANCDAGKCEAQLHNAALVRSCTHFFHRTHVQSPVHSFTQPSYFDSQES